MALYRLLEYNKGIVNDRFGAIGTVTGATFSDMEKGKALGTGFDKYIQYNQQLLPNGAFSVVVWGKITAKVTTGSVTVPTLSTSNNGTGRGLFLSYSSQLGRPILIAGATNFRYFNYIPDKNWHCWIFTISGNAQTDISSSQLFIDGISIGSHLTTSSGVQDVRSAFTYNGGSSHAAGGAHISKIKVYDTVLTQSEINKEQEEFNNTYPVIQPKKITYSAPTEIKQQGLLAAWDLSQRTGNIIPDLSGNGNNITTLSNVARRENGSDFNGANSYGSLIGSDGLVGDVTICARVFVRSNAENGRIFDNLRVVLYKHTDTNKFALSRDGGGTSALSEVILYNKWYNIVVISTFNGVTNFYLNGLLSGTINQNAGVPTNGTTWYLGNNSVFTRQFLGIIQDLKIYNRILTLPEIKAYNNQFAGRITLRENFQELDCSGAAVLPKGWIAGTGVYKGQEFRKKSGELVVNGGFDTNLTGWVNGVGATWVNGRAYFSNSTGSFSGGIIQSGKRYRIKCDIEVISGSVAVWTGTGGGASSPGLKNINVIQYSIGYSYLDLYCNNFTGYIDNVSITEVDPLPTITDGTKYLENVTAGTLAIPSKQAYGTWEWDWYKGGEVNGFSLFIISPTPNNFGAFRFAFSSSEIVYLIRVNTTTGVDSWHLFATAPNYLQNNTWYRVKITRTPAGVFTTLLKGGNLIPTAGYDGWTLVSTTGGTGTNPVTETLHTSSNFMVLDLDAGDRISGILCTEGIRV